MSRTRGHAPGRGQGPPAGTSRDSPGGGGFTLVEVVVAALILVIALGGLTSSILAGVKLSRTTEEGDRAQAALESALARIEGTPFRQIFASFNADPFDDPPGAPGPGFAVAGLTPTDDDGDGFPGEIVFPVVDAGGGALELREDVDDAGFAMPRDLSGDGAWDANDHADDYVILPVRVRVRWSGASGVREVERSVLLVE